MSRDILRFVSGYNTDMLTVFTPLDGDGHQIFGGAGGGRTRDLQHAMLTLSQLSYSPITRQFLRRTKSCLGLGRISY
jgi:hypothetical protein